MQRTEKPVLGDGAEIFLIFIEHGNGPFVSCHQVENVLQGVFT
jgi:hypothetical protein